MQKHTVLFTSTYCLTGRDALPGILPYPIGSLVLEKEGDHQERRGWGTYEGVDSQNCLRTFLTLPLAEQISSPWLRTVKARLLRLVGTK